MSLQDVLLTMKGQWLRAILLVIVGSAAGVGVGLVAPATYVSSSVVLLRWVGPDAEYAITENVRYLRDVAPSYALITRRPSVLQEAIAASGSGMGVDELAGVVTADAPLDSQTIRVSVRARAPSDAMELSGALSEALVREVAREEAQDRTGAARVDARIAVRAALPTVADTPRTSLFLAVGAFFGMVSAVMSAAIEYVLRRSRPRHSMEPAAAEDEPSHIGLGHVAWLTMVAATIPWRQNSFYEGGADSVVLAKAALSLVALGISFRSYQRGARRHPVPALPVILLTVYFAVTIIGGLANGTLVPSLVVTTRVMMLMTAIVFLVASYGARRAVGSLMQVLGFIAVLGALSGLPSFSGRLAGVLPSLNPNALAFITAVVCVWLLATVLAGKDSTWQLFAIAGCVGIVYLTGSRSALAALAVASLLMCLRVTGLRRMTLLLVALSLPLMTYLALGTDLISAVFMRGGSEQVLTLSNRTIAWRAAVSIERDWWQTWFGQGLAQKKIAVPGQWWDTQLLDSSWLSAFVQGGNVGTALIVLLAAGSLFQAVHSRRYHGAAWLGLSVLTILVGLLESGLFDGSLLFIVFLGASLGAFGGRLDAVVTERIDDDEPPTPACKHGEPAINESPVTEMPRTARATDGGGHVSG